MYEIIEDLNIKSPCLNCDILPNAKEKELIRRYTKYDSYEINSSLREGLKIDEEYNPLILFFEKVCLKKNITVFRGVSGKEYVEWFKETFNIGSIYPAFGFTSTSISSEVAYYFPHGKKDKNDLYINFRIFLPKEKNSYFIKDYSHAPNELEVLIKNGTLFKIKNINEIHNELYIDMEVL